MVIPDFELICEIMLVAEGFIDARLLARKFICLYTLCKELLSKQVHASPFYLICFKGNLSKRFFWSLCRDCETSSHLFTKKITRKSLFDRIITIGA